MGTEKVLKEFNVSGKVNGRILIVEKAKVERITLDAPRRGEPVFLRNITILSLRAR